jgi:hypothetical protein
MYNTGRYFTMTGDSWPNERRYRETKAELSALHHDVFGSATTSIAVVQQR